ncbi:ABC transporter substrate-binding protein [Aeromonas veronii]|uniref:ABC transporter substrate-binding protein n=1 Tax=Aeromonas veronii TaxID=654 RepID=UPI0024445276|nr:ABC transporter substrate-binding protein [Aeromonas veronii]
MFATALILRVILVFSCLFTLFPSKAKESHEAEPSDRPRILQAHLGEVPGLINADHSGPFVELVRLIDDFYPNIRIDINIYPIGRAMAGVSNGIADFSLPAIRAFHNIDILPYRFSSCSFSKVAHIIYSHIHYPVTADMVYGIVPAKREILIEAVPDEFSFPVQRSMSIEQSLRKVSRKRIDAFIWAQEEADIKLRELDLKNIRREYLGDFENVFIIQRGDAGDNIEKLLCQAIEKLSKMGKLEKIRALHRPYEEWQPKITVENNLQSNQ